MTSARSFSNAARRFRAGRIQLLDEGTVLHARGADVDDGRTRSLTEVGRHERGAAKCRHEDVSLAAHTGQVYGARMARRRHGGAAIQQQQRHGLPHDVAAPDHHGALAAIPMPDRSRISMTPDGVQAASDARP